MKKGLTRIFLILLVLALTAAVLPAAGAGAEAAQDGGLSYTEWKEQLFSAPRFTFSHHKDGIWRGTCAVYLAPVQGALRLANGYQNVDTNHDIYEGGYTEEGWLFVRYKNDKGYTRVGYIPGYEVRGFKSSLSMRTFARIDAVAAGTIPVTDNPVKDGEAFTELNEGDSFTILGKYVYTGNWWYIECIAKGKTARGFIPRETAAFYPGEDVADNLHQAPVTLETLGAPEKSPLETELMGYVVVNGKEGDDRKRVRGDATSDSKWLTSVYPGRRYPCYGIKTGERRKDWYYVFVEEDSVWGYVLGGFVTFEK